MLPDWLMQNDSYVPPKDGGTFLLKSMKSIGGVMARIRIQRGHEKGRHLPAILKLFLMLAVVLTIAIARNGLMIMAIAALLLAYLCTWPAADIWNIVRTSLGAELFALLVLIPAMILRPAGIGNDLLIALRVFLSVTAVGMFNHTTQWNHITGAMKKLHIPCVFIFTLDITLKYIVLLGNLIVDLLTSLQLRSVGKNFRKYQSVGGIMGVTLLRGTEMNREMYEAMQCRGFTDDYEGL